MGLHRVRVKVNVITPAGYLRPSLMVHDHSTSKRFTPMYKFEHLVRYDSGGIQNESF